MFFLKVGFDCLAAELSLMRARDRLAYLSSIKVGGDSDLTGLESDDRAHAWNSELGFSLGSVLEHVPRAWRRGDGERIRVREKRNGRIKAGGSDERLSPVPIGCSFLGSTCIKSEGPPMGDAKRYADPRDSVGRPRLLFRLD